MRNTQSQLQLPTQGHHHNERLSVQCNISVYTGDMLAIKALASKHNLYWVSYCNLYWGNVVKAIIPYMVICFFGGSLAGNGSFMWSRPLVLLVPYMVIHLFVLGDFMWSRPLIPWSWDIFINTDDCYSRQSNVSTRGELGGTLVREYGGETSQMQKGMQI